MFGLIKKDTSKTLEPAYKMLLERAMHIQRSGDLKAYAAMMDEAEKIAVKIEQMRKSA